ncbi:MAG: PAS domain S-box protein [Planctomycetota bacterium]|jgi:PAS domain S-box-containing protein
MNDTRKIKKRNPGKKNLLILVFLLVGFMVAVIAGSMMYMFNIANRLRAAHAPLMDSAIQMKVEVITAHLWLEEIINGDPNMQMDDIVAHLDKAYSYAQTILQTGQSEIGGLEILSHPQLRPDTEKVIEKLSQFRENTLRRWVVKDVAGSGTDIDKKYDALFDNLTKKIDRVQADLDQAINHDLTQFRRRQTTLITASLAITFVVAVFIIALLLKQAKTHNKLSTANQQLNEGNQLLRATEEKLLRANQKLEEWVKERTDELQEGTQILQTEITIRKRAEEQMDIFKRFAEASKDGLGMAELDGKITYVNTTLTKIIGEKKPDDVIGKNVRKYYEPKDLPKLEEEIIPTIIKQGHQTIEMPLLSKDGKSTPTIQSLFLIQDEKGQPFRLANVVTDITELKNIQQQLREHKENLEQTVTTRTRELEKSNEELQCEIAERRRMEKALLESEKNFKSLVQTAPSVILSLSPDYKILEFNEEAEKVYGCKREDAIGKNYIETFLAPQEKEKVVEDIEKVLDGQPTRGFENTIKAADGSERILMWNVNRVIDEKGNPLGIIAAGQDITERKKTEAALNFTQFAVDKASVAAFWMGPDAKFIYVNDNACNSLGYSSQELLSMTVHDIDPNFPAEAWPNHWRELKEKGSITIESLHRSKEGKEIPVVIATNFIEFDGKEYNCAFARDITDQKQAEEALRHSLQTSHDIVQTIPSGLFLYQYEAPDKLILLSGNPEAQHLTGINLQDSIGKEFNDIWPQAKSTGITDSFLNVAKTGQSFESEELIYEDQRLKGFFRTRVFSLPGNRLASAFENVTERKLAEQALEESEERHRSLIEHIPTVSWKSDENGNTIFISPNVEQVYGYTFQEICEKGKELWFDRIHPDDKEKVLKAYEMLFAEGEKYDVEYRIQRKDDDWIWLHDKAENIGEQDGVRYAYGAFLDITKRKKAEEALRNSEEKFRSYIDNAPDGVMVVNREGRFIEANKAACQITGYPKEELLNLSVPDILAPESQQAGKDHFNKVINTGYASDEMLYKTKDGDLGYWNVDAVKISEDRFLGFVKDITERKRAEQQVQMHQTELAHAWRLNTMGEMSTGMAHELNQPLCAVLNYAQACSRLVKDNEQLNSEKLDDALEQIITQTTRAGEIIRRIRQLVGKREPEVMPVDMNNIVREVLDMETSEAGQKHIELQTQLDEHLPSVLADRIEIEQVILNLVRNAFEAMSNTESDERRLTIQTTKTNENKIMIAVRDNGRGLSPDETEKVFDSFFTTSSKGLGIGLSISRTIVEAHKGHLWAESNPDRGATFKFTLPISGQ